MVDFVFLFLGSIQEMRGHLANKTLANLFEFVDESGGIGDPSYPSQIFVYSSIARSDFCTDAAAPVGTIQSTKS